MTNKVYIKTKGLFLVWFRDLKRPNIDQNPTNIPLVMIGAYVSAFCAKPYNC